MVRLTWVFAAYLLVACGGSSNSDLTSGNGGSHNDASAGSGGSSGSGTGGGMSTGGTAGSGAAGGATTGGTGGSATGGMGGSMGGTGGSTAGSGGTGGGTGGTGGTGGQPAAGSVNCGLKTCTIASQSCCFGSNITPYCYAKGTFNGCKCGIGCETAVVNCDGPEDCATGEVCCATKGNVTGGSHFDHLACTKFCQSGITTTAAVVCHLNTSGECDGGKSCITDPRLPGGYGLCGP